MTDEQTPLLPSIQENGKSCSVRQPKFPCTSTRYVLAVVSCLGFVNVYALRVNLSVAIVQMAGSTATAKNGSARIFNWSPTEEGQVLASFYYGYIITQIPGGLLAQKIGARWVFGVGIAMTAVLTLLTPLAAYTRVELLIFLRAMEGFFEGVTFPAITVLWSEWAPPMERSRLYTISSSGVFIGTFLSFPLSGLLVQYGFDGGWPSVFYVFGSVGLVWFLLWIFVGYSSPASHPRISRQERNYIEASLAVEGTAIKEGIPLWAIATSPAVWAMIVGLTTVNWTMYTLLTCMPTFLKQAVNLKELKSPSVVLAGVFSAIPYFLMIIMVIVSGQLADFMRKYMSTTVVRKIMNSTTAVFGTLFLLLCGYLGTTTITSVSLLTVAMGFHGFVYAGVCVNQLDLSPRFSGLLVGVSNTVGTIPGILTPIVVKAIVHEPSLSRESDAYSTYLREEWRDVFIVSAEIAVFGAFIYLIIGSGEKQPWADGKGKAMGNRNI